MGCCQAKTVEEKPKNRSSSRRDVRRRVVVESPRVPTPPPPPGLPPKSPKDSSESEKLLGSDDVCDVVALTSPIAAAVVASIISQQNLLHQLVSSNINLLQQQHSLRRSDILKEEYDSHLNHKITFSSTSLQCELLGSLFISDEQTERKNIKIKYDDETILISQGEKLQLSEETHRETEIDYSIQLFSVLIIKAEVEHAEISKRNKIINEHAVTSTETISQQHEIIKLLFDQDVSRNQIIAKQISESVVSEVLISRCENHEFKYKLSRQRDDYLIQSTSLDEEYYCKASLLLLTCLGECFLYNIWYQIECMNDYGIALINRRRIVQREMISRYLPISSNSKLKEIIPSPDSLEGNHQRSSLGSLLSTDFGNTDSSLFKLINTDKNNNNITRSFDVQETSQAYISLYENHKYRCAVIFGRILYLRRLLLLTIRKWILKKKSIICQQFGRSAYSLRCKYAAILQKQLVLLYKSKAGVVMKKKLTINSNQTPSNEEMTNYVRNTLTRDKDCNNLLRLLSGLPRRCRFEDEETNLVIKQQHRSKRNTANINDKDTQFIAACCIQRCVRRRQSKNKLHQKKIQQQETILPSYCITSLYSNILSVRFGCYLRINRFRKRWKRHWAIRQSNRVSASIRIQTVWRRVLATKTVQSRRTHHQQIARQYLSLFADVGSDAISAYSLIQNEEIKDRRSLLQQSTQSSERIRVHDEVKQRDLTQEKHHSGILKIEEGRNGLNDDKDRLRKASVEIRQHHRSSIEVLRGVTSQTVEESRRLRNSIFEELSADGEEFDRRMSELEQQTDIISGVVNKARKAEDEGYSRKSLTVIQLPEADPNGKKHSRRSFAAPQIDNTQHTIRSTLPDVTSLQQITMRSSPVLIFSQNCVDVFHPSLCSDDATSSQKTTTKVDRSVAMSCRRDSTIDAFTYKDDCYATFRRPETNALLISYLSVEGQWREVSLLRFDHLWSEIRCFEVSKKPIIITYYSSESSELGIASLSNDFLEVIEMKRIIIGYKLKNLSHDTVNGVKLLLFTNENCSLFKIISISCREEVFEFEQPIPELQSFPVNQPHQSSVLRVVDDQVFILLSSIDCLIVHKVVFDTDRSYKLIQHLHWKGSYMNTDIISPTELNNKNIIVVRTTSGDVCYQEFPSISTNEITSPSKVLFKIENTERVFALIGIKNKNPSNDLQKDDNRSQPDNDLPFGVVSDASPLPLPSTSLVRSPSNVKKQLNPLRVSHSSVSITDGRSSLPVLIPRKVSTVDELRRRMTATRKTTSSRIRLDSVVSNRGVRSSLMFSPTDWYVLLPKDIILLSGYHNNKTA